jgi:hypothetical protein
VAFDTCGIVTIWQADWIPAQFQLLPFASKHDREAPRLPEFLPRQN